MDGNEMRLLRETCCRGIQTKHGLLLAVLHIVRKGCLQTSLPLI